MSLSINCHVLLLAFPVFFLCCWPSCCCWWTFHLVFIFSFPSAPPASSSYHFACFVTILLVFTICVTGKKNRFATHKSTHTLTNRSIQIWFVTISSSDMPFTCMLHRYVVCAPLSTRNEINNTSSSAFQK